MTALKKRAENTAKRGNAFTHQLKSFMNVFAEYRFFDGQIMRFIGSARTEVTEKIQTANPCTKKPYDKKGAQTVLNHRKYLGADKHLRAYHCPTCNHWHLTHKERAE